ncbi:MAG: hypothetical protein WAM94_15915 [Chromatiaceae bacterium]
MNRLTIKDLPITDEGDGHPDANRMRELSRDELRRVNGGMKWERGTPNADVIDARGGQTVILGLTLTFDINGNVSSVS